MNFLKKELPLPENNGAVVTFEAHGERLTVKKKKAGEYVALVVGTTEHGRWGNAEEIREDVAHFLDNGTLPRGKRMF